MGSYLEHANITAINVDEVIRFLQTAMPDWKIRADVSGDSRSCQRWVHLGTDVSYIAIEDRGVTEKGPHEPYVHQGVNHLGFVVDDLDAVSKRLTEGGYSEGLKVPINPNRKRVYFFDNEGNEYEFVEYLKPEITSRNDYSDK